MKDKQLAADSGSGSETENTRSRLHSDRMA
jgi:hypothetical protein